MEELETLKIQKAISISGYCSRREAEELILKKQVLVNNEIAKIGQRVSIKDVIVVNGKTINFLKQPDLYILFNKPRGLICTNNDPENRKTIFEYLNLNQYCYSVGRLDFNTTGVIIITNDGGLANKLAHPSSEITRSYLVSLDRSLSTQEIKFLNSNRVILENKPSKQNVSYVKDNDYIISLNEGRNHHVKKIFNLVQTNVLKLHRFAYGPLTDHNLKIGKFRNLTKDEIKLLKSL
ncbi:ribosomal large subunit pseudouridine synthase B [Metamycoplasma cloacale]|uniref:Pseudouridine synthase n=1 Tax=Metamycoplasma cloacale TaxID=92401 RepID=A0A2Z4LM46_9BACT|nr:pseudouridine synthase [Metamycoplasma cloacale]AWX42833.1 rRNA pseudouridine synthase [Metamycoplasma cloacale]VEU79348.1 ribosomal large subunit pseudouridine synthase B [Metamycoplasma cloacale]